MYPPTPTYSETDKRLRVLMAKLLLEHMDQGAVGSNLPAGMVTLTDGEANELIARIEDLVNSRDFLEASYFVEGLTIPGVEEEARVREIYLSARRRRGRTRVLASTHWSEFQVRLGITRNVVRGTRAEPMSFEYFREMEKRLLLAAGIHRRVIELVIRVVGSQAPQIEEIRIGQRSLGHGTVRQLVIDPLRRWHEQLANFQGRHVSTTRIAAALTIVADTGVLFTTRDWSVAGTLSTMAGALARIIHDGRMI